MAWAVNAYTDAPWAAPEVPSTITVGAIPPPVPKSSQSFTWGAPSPVRPWAAGGWAGGIAPAVYHGGGVQADPDSDTGVVNVQVWWPNVRSLELMRLTPDGVATPVRGGFPIATGPTRFNYCSNPSGQVSNAGYFPRTGGPTFTAPLVRADTNGPYLGVNVTSTGTVSFDLPYSGLPGRGAYTIGFDLLLPRRPGTGVVTMNFTDNMGVATASATTTIDNDALNNAIGQWARVFVNLTAPNNATTVTQINVSFTSMVTSDQIGISEATVETNHTDGSPADGNLLGGLWTGTVGLSTSMLASIATVVDGEAPLDVPVMYQVWNTSISGGFAQSIQVTLDSNGTSWLSHSSDPGNPASVSPTVVPSVKKTLQQTTLTIIGRSHPVVITAGVRQAPSGTITLDTPTVAYRAQILDMMDDGSPLLLRAPAEYGYGYSQWMAFGDVDVDPQGRLAYHGTRFLNIPYQEVDAPTNTNLVL
jgi:hypothetical protein